MFQLAAGDMYWLGILRHTVMDDKQLFPLFRQISNFRLCISGFYNWGL